MAKVSEETPVLEREIHFTGGIANPFRPVTGGVDFFVGRVDLKQGGTVKTISPLHSEDYAGAEWLFFLRSDDI